VIRIAYCGYGDTVTGDTDRLQWLWRQSLSEQELQKFNVERFGLEDLNIVKAIEQRQFDINNRFAA
jgi:hypothetical protein